MKANRSARSRLAGDDVGVSDVLGSILLVGLTVIMAAALGALLLSLDGPTDLQHTSLVVTLDPGADGKWQGEAGDIDSESVRITHVGGEAIVPADLSARLRIGNATSMLTGEALAAASGVGSRFSVAETLVSNQSLARNVTVSADLIVRLTGGGGQVLASTAVIAGTQIASSICSSDVLPPVATLPLSQAPTDLASTSSGNVTITALVTDNCSGVNTASPPQLWSCLAVSCTYPGGYTNQGNMALVNGTWVGTIVHPGSWLGDLGKTLNYRLVAMRDLAGNQADSAIQTDQITLFTSYAYVQSFSATTGTVSNPTYAQNAIDGLETTLAEAASAGASGQANLTARSSGITTSGAWTTSTNAAGSDDNHATTTAEARTITVPLSDPVGSPGTITQVVVQAEVSIAGANNDRFEIFACILTTCNTPNSVLGPISDTVFSYDVTAQRPGGGSWSWTDITNLQVRVGTIRSGGVDGTWRVDNVAATVSYLPTYTTSIQANFTGVTAGTTAVQLSYRNTGDTFRLEYCTLFVSSCTAWSSLGNLTSSATLTTASFTLPGPGYLLGSPKLRILDNTASTTQGVLYLDYLRIATT